MGGRCAAAEGVVYAAAARPSRSRSPTKALPHTAAAAAQYQRCVFACMVMRSSNKNCSSSRGGWWWQQATLRLVYACCAGDAAFVPLDLGRESSAASAEGVGPYYLLRPETFASQL
eukprot:SAG25_NODE_6625_length_544_cov_0.889888_1_plen_115_part_01